MDRLLPLATPHIRKSADGTFYHDGRVRRYPRVFFVANCGFPGEHNFDLLKAMVVQMSPVLEVYRNCGEVLGDPGAADIPAISEFYDALRQAGKEMVTGGRVSEETARRIHAELIESPRILVTSVVSKRRHILRKSYQNSLQLPVPVHIYVILSMSG